MSQEPTENTDLIQGTLDMLILKALSLEPMHGFGISRRIEQTSRGVFKVNPGSLLTAFQRLERAGLVDAEWRQTDNAPARQVLHAHPRRPEAARGRNDELDPPRVRRRAAAESGRLADVTLAPADARPACADQPNRGRRDSTTRCSTTWTRPRPRTWRAGCPRPRRAAPRAARWGAPTAVREQVRDYGWESAVGTLARRRALRRTDAAQEPGLHRRGRARDLARQRRGHDDLQRHECAAAPAVAGGRRSRARWWRLRPARPDGTAAEQGSYAYYAYLRDRAHTLDGMAAWGRVSLTIATGGEGTRRPGQHGERRTTSTRSACVRRSGGSSPPTRIGRRRRTRSSSSRTRSGSPAWAAIARPWAAPCPSTAIRSRSSASRRNRFAASTPACRRTHGSR